MAKSEKKVSIRAVDNIISERFSNVVSEQWYDVEVKMRRNLPFTEMLTFANDVVQSCFQRDGVYTPEVLDFAIKSNIIGRYTNVSLPDNLEHRYEILYNTDLMDFIYKYINMAQVQEIVSSINKKLDYMCETNAAAVQSRLNDLVSSFEEVQKKMEDLFKDLAPDDLTRLISAIGGAGLSEDKVVEAYLAQTKAADAEPVKVEE